MVSTSLATQTDRAADIGVRCESLVDQWILNKACGSENEGFRMVIDNLIKRVVREKSVNQSMGKLLEAHGARANKISANYTKVLHPYYKGYHKQALVDQFEENFSKLKKLGNGVMTLTVVNNNKCTLSVIDSLRQSERFFQSNECEEFMNRLFNTLLRGSLAGDGRRSEENIKNIFTTTLKRIRTEKGVVMNNDRRSEAEREVERVQALNKTRKLVSNWNDDDDRRMLKLLREHLSVINRADLSSSKNGYALSIQEKRAEELKLVIRKMSNGFSAMRNQLVKNEMKLNMMMSKAADGKIEMDVTVLNTLDWAAPENFLTFSTRIR